MKELKKAEEKLVKSLTKKRLELLLIIFRFRFVTSLDLSNYLGQSVKSGGSQRRLERLLELGYIKKRYNGNYKIQGRAAEYFLSPKAISVLNKAYNNLSSAELHLVYSRVKASDRFVDRSIKVLQIHNKLKFIYGDNLNFVTKPQLNVEDYDYFPYPLPDAFFSLNNKVDYRKYFFLEYFDDNVSIGIHGRKILNYMKYKEDGGWDDTDLEFPTVVIICQSQSMLSRAEKRIRFYERQEESGIKFYLIDFDKLATIKSDTDNAWFDPIEKDKITL